MRGRVINHCIDCLLADDSVTELISCVQPPLKKKIKELTDPKRAPAFAVATLASLNGLSDFFFFVLFCFFFSLNVKQHQNRDKNFAVGRPQTRVSTLVSFSLFS